MKRYYCTKCKKAISSEEVLGHRNQCGPGADIALAENWRRFTGPNKHNKKLWAVIALLLLAGSGIWLSTSGYRSIAKMRQLERIPQPTIDTALQGEVNLSGRAERLNDQSILKGPKSGAPCLYYRYLVEKRADDDWDTVSENSSICDYKLTDETGSIDVQGSLKPNFNLSHSFQIREGEYRYTEWRIDSGQKINVIGYYEETATEREVRFDRDGHYMPIISTDSGFFLRAYVAETSLYKCWFGFMLMAFFAMALMNVLKIHRILVYFSTLGVVVLFYSTTFGLIMMKQDLMSGVERLKSHESAVHAAIEDCFKEHEVQLTKPWKELDDFRFYCDQGLSEEAANRLSHIRLDFALACEKVRRHNHAIPARWLISLWDIASPDLVKLTSEEQAQYETRIAGYRKISFPRKTGRNIIIGASFVGFFGLVFGFMAVRTKRQMENLPTSSTAGAVYGLSEFKGLVALSNDQEPLIGPLTGKSVVQYIYNVSEKRGDEWKQVKHEEKIIPFLCQDADGSIAVNPADAVMLTMHSRKSVRSNKEYLETWLEVGDPLYAMGECVLNPISGDSLCLQNPKDDDFLPLLLSNKTEAAVTQHIASNGMMVLNFAFLAILIIVLVLFGIAGSFSAANSLVAGLVGPLFMSLVMLVMHYNDLVFLRRRADRNASNIQVSLKKRHNLIPQLEQVAKTYMKHESEVLTAITKMRSAYGGGRTNDEAKLGTYINIEHQALSRILAVYENYPELKTNAQAAMLMRQLILLENEVAFMRIGYNDAAETYNTRIQVFPDILFAKLFRFSEKNYLHGESEIVAVPPSIQKIWEKETDQHETKES